MKKISLVTGGSSGLGFELSKQLIALGKTVCIIGKNEAKLKKALTKLGNGAFGFGGDVSDEAFIKSVMEQLKAKNHTIEYLFNCAGVGLFGDPDKNNSEMINSVIDSNLKGTIIVTNHALELMKQNGGKIINIISSAGLKGNPLESVYCASKWGARGYTESLKAYFKGSNIKVIGVYPGGMNTPFWNESRNYVSVEKANSFMNPKEVALVIINNVVNNKVSVSDINIERP